MREREKKLEDNMNLDNHIVISNIHQRLINEKGERPALIVNNKKYTIEILTITLVSIPWGVEATWVLLTPKYISKVSIVKKIVVGSIHVKPNSRKKQQHMTTLLRCTTSLMLNVAEGHIG